VEGIKNVKTFFTSMPSMGLMRDLFVTSECFVFRSAASDAG